MRAVGELDAVPRVPPALVAEALRRARRVLDVAVAVAVAVLVDPVERGERVVPAGAHERVVAGPAPVLGEQDQPQRRGVGGAVVRAVRLLAEQGQLAAAELVQDLARLLVPEVVDLRALERRQQEQRAARELRPEPQRL